jgi:hypothetical protein
MSQSAQLIEKTRARIEKLRGRGQTETQKVRERIKKWRAGGSSLSSASLISEVREKGLVETLRARREAWTTRYRAPTAGSKEYRKETIIEGSAGQLKVQKPRISIEA